MAHTAELAKCIGVRGSVLEKRWQPEIAQNCNIPRRLYYDIRLGSLGMLTLKMKLITSVSYRFDISVNYPLFVKIIQARTHILHLVGMRFQYAEEHCSSLRTKVWPSTFGSCDK